MVGGSAGAGAFGASRGYYELAHGGEDQRSDSGQPGVGAAVDSGCAGSGGREAVGADVDAADILRGGVDAPRSHLRAAATPTGFPAPMLPMPARLAAVVDCRANIEALGDEEYP